MKKTFSVFLFLALSIMAWSQAPAHAAAPNTKDPVAAALGAIMTRQQGNLINAITAMPADKFGYKPTPDQITFGHLAAHIAEANYNFCAAVGGVALPKIESKESDPKDTLLAAAKASFDFCSDALAKMDDSKLGEQVDLFGSKTSRAGAVLRLASAWADHYGAAAMYLRLNGILPPSAQPKK
ncbi:MAG: DinB family protein [Terriglobales bacterium]